MLSSPTTARASGGAGCKGLVGTNSVLKVSNPWNVMRISYRVTSMLVVVTYLLVSTIEWVAESPHAASPTVASEFDPCLMLWEQVPATVRISTLVWFTSFLILLVQGFRNRAVPRWLAIACLIALVPTFHHQLWRVQQCYTKLGAVDLWICIGTVCLMCLHQTFQRRLRVVAQPKG